ncbi:type II secretion system F family protein [Nocardioides dubius]|uniref:Type II secretion system protein GspF domain-containing protein n=1 Tax=Nocardioides dubius TaxID=317019 RepID=A0ABP4ELD6_9ACTN
MIMLAGLLVLVGVLLGAPGRWRARIARLESLGARASASGLDGPTSSVPVLSGGESALPAGRQRSDQHPARRSAERSEGVRGRRVPLAALAGGGVALAQGGAAGIACGVGLAVAVWVIAGRVEPAAERRAREQRARQLPDVVTLLGLALRSGAPVALALEQVRMARPGPAADALAEAGLALQRGVSPERAWAPLLADPAMARLARGLIRSAESGAPVAEVVARIGQELALERRMAVADRARAVGVRAALPLGVCLLPAFLLIGIVPLVAASLATLPR